MFVVLPTASSSGFARETQRQWSSLGKSLPDGFRYTSETNPEWLTD